MAGGPSDRGASAQSAAFSRRKSHSRTILLAAAACALIVAIGVGVAISSGGAEPGRGPGPLVAALAETEWRFPPDPSTGYRRLTTPFRDARIDRIDGNDAGVLAWAMQYGNRPWVVVWHERAWRPHPLSPGDRVSALGVDPDGVVHVGFADGRLARIRGDGALEMDAAVSIGNSIVGFAFDRKTRKSALMLSGGEVRTALRPLETARLSVVRMPERASVGTLIYDADGDLVVAGAGGAVFVSSDDGWEERPLPTSGEVVALGLGEGDDLLAVESNGHAFRGSGTWDRVGTVDGRPIAISAIPDHGVVVASSNGHIEAASSEAGAFAHVSGWQAPGDFAATQALVLGANVLFAGSDRLLAWDGQRFDSYEIATPDGTVTREGCTPIVAAHGGELPTAFFDCGSGHHAVLGDGVLENVEALEIGEQNVAAADFARTMRDARVRNAIVIGDTLFAPSPVGHPPAVLRFPLGAAGWQPFATLDPEAGDVVSLAAGHGDLWASTRSGALFHASLTDPVFTPIPDFQTPATLYPLAESRALALHYPQATPLCFQGDTPQGNTDCVTGDAIALFEDSVGTARAFQLPGAVLLIEPQRIRTVNAEGPPVEWTLEDDVDLSMPSSSSPFDFAAGDGEVLLRTYHGAVVRCRDARCAKVPLPEHIYVAGITRTPDGRLVIAEPNGVVGVVEPR